jgi:hypothetical protein
MAELTLREAAARLDLSPLEILLQCALHGVPCESGRVDEEVLPLLGSVHAPVSDREADRHEARQDDESDEERRLRIVRRILERLSGMGKYWPARTEKRATARGLEGPDVGLALRAVDALLDAGLLREEHSGHEPRVGLEGDRRREIADIAGGRPIEDEQLRTWVAEG